jgi:signal transduction histidine kinase
MKLWLKIVLLNVLLVMSLGILLGLAVRGVVIDSLRQELSRQGESIARNLSERIADSVLLQDIYRTQEAINDLVKTERDVEYIFVLDDNGELIAHTFKNGHPPGVLRWNPLYDRPTSVQLLETERGFVRDIGVKVFSDMNPEVHVGMREERIMQTLARIRYIVITLTIGVTVTGAALACLFSRFITQPLNTLVRFADLLSRGEFGKSLDVKSKDEIGELSSTFNHLSHELESYRKKMEDSYKQMLRTEKLTALGRLSAGLAHEIRNPLTSIKVLFKAFRDNPSLTREDMEVVLSAAEQMDDILSRFLRFARGDEFNPSEVYINLVIKEVVNLTQHQAKNQRVTVEIDLTKLPPVKADRGLMEQAIMNLVLNAIEAMPEGGTLTVASRNDDGHYIISVADTGQGIPEEIREKIFDPFFTTKGDGTGLGLSIVYNIVNLHSGDISFENNGAGTTFTMKIPVHA